MCKDTGLGSFPLQGDAANRIWRLVMTLACEILACSQILSLTGIQARKWEPRMIRLRLMKYSRCDSLATPAASSCIARPDTLGSASSSTL